MSRRTLSLAALLLGAFTAAGAVPPPWAYGFHEEAALGVPLSAPPTLGRGNTAPNDPTLYGLPGSKLHFTRAQIGSLFAPADWYPEDHPVMPEVVAHGRQPSVVACALCHHPNGKGRPENSSLAGLPTAYFVEQINSFRNDERKTSDARKYNTSYMATIAKGLTDDEIRQAAEYYGSMKFGPWVTVLETDTVPRTTTSVGLFLPFENGEREPIGRRVVEVPQNVQSVEILRSPRVGFIAYAPIGSIEKGKILVTADVQGRVPCARCHGEDLQGMGNIPGIAGRSPSYLVRQMFDMKSGHRTGPGVEPMKPILANLDEDDLLAIAAYVASRSPR